SISLPFNNAADGIIDVQTGIITLAAGGSSAGGVFTLGSGTALDLAGAGTNTLTGAYTASGQGVVELTAGTLNLSATAVTFNFPAGVFQWIGAAISNGTLTASDGITLSGAADKSLSAATLVNNGTIAQTGGRLLLTSGTINNPSGARYDLQDDTGL